MRSDARIAIFRDAMPYLEYSIEDQEFLNKKFLDGLARQANAVLEEMIQASERNENKDFSYGTLLRKI